VEVAGGGHHEFSMMNRRNFEKTELSFLHYCNKANRSACTKRFSALWLVASRLPSFISDGLE
jgi:hypothetical protein